MVLHDIVKLLKEKGVVKLQDLGKICQNQQKMNFESQEGGLSAASRLQWLDVSLDQISEVMK